ncbi:MAG: DUF1707 domain-containing protein [Streptosporangiales bacterium]|nr:DUF1707 domain-containing protein [Streptosporangiales bacterium]
MAAPASNPPASPDSDGRGLRASDSERDEAAGELGEHYAAGRLSPHTFEHRMSAAMSARRRSQLPPLLADLPPRERTRSPLAARWLKVRDEAGAVMRSVLDGLGLGSGGYPALPPPPAGAVSAARPPAPLPFPRGSGTSFTIGRDRECDLTLEDPTVSREHAILQRASADEADSWTLTDLDSTNGTRVNGWRVRGTAPVRAGDIVRFGESEHTLTPSGD